MSSDFSRRTKIVCTIGPQSESPAKLNSLMSAGMNVARLNFSHGSHEEHLKKIKLIRKISQEKNKTVAIMQDLAGPKIRTGDIENNYARLFANHELILTTDKILGNQNRVSINYRGLPDEAKPGDRILLSDGSIELHVAWINGHEIGCKVVVGGILGSHKGVNVTSETLKLSGMTHRDKLDLKFGLENNVDLVAMSFVREPKDVLDAKNIIQRAGKSVPVIAKIEKPEAVKNIDSILEVADGIMVARGDLGVEIPLEEVPGVQKMLIRKANYRGKPVITATQMLSSMVDHARPTRAEVTDVANAILDGTDAVMLSEESATGKYPVQAVNMLSRIALEAEKEYFSHTELKKRYPDYGLAVPEAISYSAYLMADELNAKAIITPTMSGSTCRLISRYRPKAQIFALSPKIETVRALSVVWGTQAFHIPELVDSADIFDQIKAAVKSTGRVKKNDKIIVTAGLPLRKSGITNLIKVIVVS